MLRAATSGRMPDADVERWRRKAAEAAVLRIPGVSKAVVALTAERPGATYTTPPLPTEFPASHLGVHWRYPAPLIQAIEQHHDVPSATQPPSLPSGFV